MLDAERALEISIENGAKPKEDQAQIILENIFKYIKKAAEKGETSIVYKYKNAEDFRYYGLHEKCLFNLGYGISSIFTGKIITISWD